MSTAQPKWKTVTFWVLSILLGLAFLAAGGSKLAGGQQYVDGFAHYGFPRWFLTVTGSVEVLGAVLILIPRTRFYGAGLLVCTMIGAALTHIRAGEWDHLPAPIVLLVLSAIVAWGNRPDFLKPGAERVTGP